ncbi:MAG: 3-hydroxyacyl-CoA dehydrogenase NAD-binding domain-containing protein, partial [Alphaproteobacteria bacterium]
MKVAVVGGGTMGNGIVHVCTQNGHDVTLIDLNAEVLKKAVAVIDKNLGRMVKKEKITEDEKAATLGRITTAESLDAAADADLAIEA